MQSRLSLLNFLACIMILLAYFTNTYENYRLIKQIKVLTIDNGILEEENFRLKNELENIK